MTIEQITADIRQMGDRGKPILIAVEGFGGSGKSTLAQKLVAELGSAYAIGMDDFIVKEKLTEPSWDRGAFDRRRLEEQVLIPVSQGKPASYQKLLWGTNTLSEPVAIPEVDYLIIEGITAYHPDIEQYYDYKIWVDTPIEIAKQRGRARDGVNENASYWNLWAQNDLDYQQQYRPKQRANYTVNN